MKPHLSFIFVFTINFIHVSTLSLNHRLRDSLLQHYRNDVRPVSSPNETVEVFVGIHLLKILEFGHNCFHLHYKLELVLKKINQIFENDSFLVGMEGSISDMES